MSLQRPTDPRFGSRLSASEFRNRVTNPLYANDVSLEDRMAILEGLLAAQPIDYRQAFMPDSANERDRWIDPSDNHQMWYCIETYGIGEADKPSKWVRIGDSVARSTATTATNAANSASQTVFSPTPPLSFTRGWIWVDESNANREMRCIADYDENDGPDAYPNIDSYRRSRFLATDSYANSLLAAAEQGLQDGKTYTFVQGTVPDAADAHDTWIDSDDFSAYITVEAYRSTDHDPYNSARAYVIEEVVTLGGIMYRAKGAVPISTTPPNVTYWLAAGPAFATKELFRESMWTPTTNPATVQLAADIQGLRDGKTNNFYGSTYPEAAEARDTFINSNTKQAYVCLTAYDSSLLPENRASKWTEVVDATARAAIDALDSISDGINTTYLQPTMPLAATIKDIWIDTEDEVYEIYICKATYTEVQGGSVETNWKMIEDGTKSVTFHQEEMPASAKQGNIWIDKDGLNRRYICDTTYTENPQPNYWVDLKDDKVHTFYLPNPPSAAEAGDGWLDTVTPTGQFQFYVCNANYTNGEHGFVVDGDGFVVSSGKWTPAKDTGAENTATLALAVANGKSRTWYSSDIPAKAEAGDIWVDTNETYPGTTIYMKYLCIGPYDSTPGGAQEGTPPATLFSNYYNDFVDPSVFETAQEALSEAQLAKLEALAAKGIAEAAQTANTALSDSIVTNYMQPTMPTSAGVQDLWIDTADTTYEIYICKIGYTSGGSKEVNWQMIQDGTKATTYRTDEMPPSARHGDIWIDTKDTMNRRYICTTAYQSNPELAYWDNLNDDRKQTFYLPDPPKAAEVGDGWLDYVTPSGQYQFYICNTSYKDNEHLFVDVTDSGKWTPARDVEAENNAILAINVANGKAATYYRDDIPIKANRGDFWIDTNATYPNTEYNYTYICKVTYDSTDPQSPTYGMDPSILLDGYWNIYADPVSHAYADTKFNEAEIYTNTKFDIAQDTAELANALADNQRKTIYSTTTPNASNYQPEGIRVGDLWVNDSTHTVKVCKVDHLTGINADAWEPLKTEESIAAKLTAEEALQVANAAKSVQDGVVVTFTTSGAGDNGWPGPGSLTGGSGQQWAISTWTVIGARPGDLWFHLNTSTGKRISRFCKTAYDGYATGDLGSLAHWDTFVDPAMQTDITSLQNAVDAINDSIGVPLGIANLDGSGKVPASQLPSYVDDVVEVANLAALPGTGEAGKIYVTIDNGKTYRWTGSVYVEISAGVTDHGLLSGREDDDHTQYVKADGTRAFSGVVSGVTPTASAHLATKGYVDALGTRLNAVEYDDLENIKYTVDTEAEMLAINGQSSGELAIVTNAGTGQPVPWVVRWSGASWQDQANLRPNAYAFAKSLRKLRENDLAIASQVWTPHGRYNSGIYGVASTSFDSSLIGTGIDVDSPFYLESSFIFDLEIIFGHPISVGAQSLVNYVYVLRGKLKKVSSANYVTFIGNITVGATVSSHNASGVLLRGDFYGNNGIASCPDFAYLTYINLIRVDSAGGTGRELAFKLGCLGPNIAWVHQSSLTGFHTYKGTPANSVGSDIAY